MYYYRNRIYSPELARFISKDPKGYIDGMNLYAYVMNNPLRYLDPMGTTSRSSFVSDFVDRSKNIVSNTISGTVNLPSTLNGVGNYLAEISGFRDFQNSSVIDTNFAQKQALNSTKESLRVFSDNYLSISGLNRKYNEVKNYIETSPGSVASDVVFMALPIPSKSLKAADNKKFNRSNITKGFQEHHIISWTNKHTKNHKLLKKAGFNLNSRANKIFLPTKAELHPSRSIHLGRHLNSVNKKLDATMADILTLGKANNWTQKEYDSALRAIIKDERNLLKSGDRVLNKNKRSWAE